MATGGQAESCSEEYIEYPCYVCRNNKKLSDSGHYCLFCKTFLCVTCLSGHNRYTNDHQVIAVTDSKFQKVLTERCVNHPDDVIEHYCRHHDALLCNTCQRLNHRTCTGVRQISEAADDLIADQKLQVIPGQLQSTLDRVNQVMDSIENCVEDEQQKEHTNLMCLDDYEQKLIAKIRKLAAKGRNNITTAKNQITSTANDRRNQCVIAKDLLSTYVNNVKRSQNRKAHLFIVKKKGEGILKGAEDICRESEDFIKNRPVGLRNDTQIAESLNAFSSLVTEVKLYTIGQRTNIKLDEKDCNILASCRLGDGTLVLSDNNNKRLKRVDPSTKKVIDHCNLKEKPCCLCSIGPQEVAVADKSNIVHIISAVKGLTPSRTVDMGQRTFILACHGGEFSAGGGASLRIHDMSGTMIRVISRNTDGESMFSRVSGIALNQAGDRVFVSDYDKGLVCVTRDGRAVFSLSCADMGLGGAWGVTTDHRGYVMVAGLRSHNVVQVTDKGRVVGEILAKKDGICYPKCLCFDAETMKLYVGGFTSRLLGFELL